MPKYNSTNPRPLPATEYLHARLKYLPETGELFWKQGKRAGKPAGERSKYYRIKLVGRLYMAHRIICKMMTGQEPPFDIDHKDRNRLNNRWNNLRLGTRVGAVWNRQLPRKINPHRGVFPTGKKWRARIRIGGVQHHLGTFSTVSEAAAAYEAAACKLHGEFYCAP